MSAKPYYMIDFSASACMFEVRINDYPVINMNIEGQVASTIPINYAILESGTQTISITILPNIGETILHNKAELKYNIKLFDVTHDFVFEKQFGNYQSNISADKRIPIVKHVDYFVAEVPYRLEAWQKGKNLKDIEDCREKLEVTYNKIINLIKEKKYDEYKSLISKRENNMARSMYLSQSETQSRIEDLFHDFASGFEIQSISPKALMVFYANNKVAVLKKLNGEPALHLLNHETDEELMLDISFYIPEGKENFEVI